MYLCIVMEVIQKKIAATTIVMIPGTQPKTLQETNYQSSVKAIIGIEHRREQLTRETMTGP